MVNSGLFRSFPAWYRLLTWPVRALYLRTPAEAAEGVVWALTAEAVGGESGSYYADGVAVEPSAAAQVRRSMHQGCLLNPRNLVFYPFFTHFSPSFAHFQRLDARNPGNTAKSPWENGKKSEKIVENRCN